MVVRSVCGYIEDVVGTRNRIVVVAPGPQLGWMVVDGTTTRNRSACVLDARRLWLHVVRSSNDGWMRACPCACVFACSLWGRIFASFHIASSTSFLTATPSMDRGVTSGAKRERTFSKEELDSLRREGEHLLRVGGDAVARERSNTSPMLYFGSGSDGAGPDQDEDADSDLPPTPTVGNSPERVTDELQDAKLHAVEPSRGVNGTVGSSRQRDHSFPSDVSESSDSDSDSDGNGVSLEAADGDTYINTEFDFVDFKPAEDFHMARQLISKSVWAPFGVSELAGAIIEQVEVGTVVKVNGESVCGFATIMNVHSKSIAAASKKMREFLLRSCPEENGAKKKMAAVLADGGSMKTGYYIMEQMINVPNEMAPALQRCVLDDLEWAVGSQNTGMTPAEKAELAYQYVIMMSPVFVVNGVQVDEDRDASALGALTGGGKKKKKKRQKKKQRTNGGQSHSEQVYYVKYQDEILRDFATLSYTTSLPKDGSRVPRQMGKYGTEKVLVMLIEKSALSRSVQRLQDAI